MYKNISCINKIVIESGLLTGKWVTITDKSHGNDSLEEIYQTPVFREHCSKEVVIIGKNVWIGDKVTILLNVKIGEGAIIATNTVAAKDVPDYTVVAGVPAKEINDNKVMSKPRLIAFYLPQFYPTKENDEWWQKGFTEWTNVGNAKPLFKGHYQPRVPADLGYYDLRVPDVREEQAQLARDAGIEGFCYWHYWFAGRRLLDRVFKEVVESGKPDFPFCLCWANHSWYQKTWDPTKPDKLLIEQTYPGVQDYIDHFNAMLPAFKDKRYIKVNGKLLFGLFSAVGINNEQFKCFSSTWQELAKINGLNGFEFFGFTYQSDMYDNIIGKGFSHMAVDYVMEMLKSTNYITNVSKWVIRQIIGRPNKVYSYQQYMDYSLKHFDPSRMEYPCVLPNFDHSPRSANRGFILHNSTPEKWEDYCIKVFDIYKDRPHEENIVFVKAWNEWGEGNYLEPDLKYGKKYIEALKKAYDMCK